MLVACEKKVRGGGEIGTGDRARGGRSDGRTVCCGKTDERRCRGRATRVAAETVGPDPGGITSQAADLERTVATEASHGRRRELYAWPMGGADRVHRSEEHTSELQSHHDLVCR